MNKQKVISRWRIYFQNYQIIYNFNSILFPEVIIYLALVFQKQKGMV